MSSEDEPSLANPIAYIVHHTNILSEHILSTLDNLQNIGTVDDSSSTSSPPQQQQYQVPVDLDGINVDDVEDIEGFHSTVDNVLKEILASQPQSTGPSSMSDSAEAFLTAINFKEDGPAFIYPMVAFHVFALTIVILTRRNLNAQAAIFLVLASLIYLSENLNTWASLNYEKFSTQNYFTPDGSFVGLLFSLPLLLISCIAVGSMVYNAGLLVVQVKRAEMKKMTADRAKEGLKKGGKAKEKGKSIKSE
jgi:hypothetical protein